MSGTAARDDVGKPKRFAALRRLVEAWAVGGGLLLIGVILMIVYSVLADVLIGQPVAGDFEMVEMGVAVAVFAFLPYCTMTGAHVSADLFTEWAGPTTKKGLAVNAALIGILISAILLWRVSLGLTEQIAYGETTAIISIPLWWAFVPIVASLGLLLVASLIALVDAWAPPPDSTN